MVILNFCPSRLPYFSNLNDGGIRKQYVYFNKHKGKIVTVFFN